jgi:hypothetical protein
MSRLELLIKQLESRDHDKKDEARVLLATFYPNDYSAYLASKLRQRGLELLSRLRREVAA